MTALLTQLAEMRAADAGAKAVVFSAWGRLLKLVGGALAANGVQHVSLAGAQPAARAQALRRFIHDPDCAVILIVLSTGGARTPPFLLETLWCGETLNRKPFGGTAFAVQESLSPQKSAAHPVMRQNYSLECKNLHMYLH